MLTNIGSLSAFIAQEAPPRLDRWSVERLMHRNLTYKTGVTWKVRDDGSVDLETSKTVDLNKFVSNGKLQFQWNNVRSPVVALNEVRDLDGCPRSIIGSFDVRSNTLTSLKGGPRKANVYFVEANYLDDLHYAPEVVERLIVHSTNLRTCAGLEHISAAQVDLRSCVKVTDTTGLSGACITSELKLPSSITEITELPYILGDLIFDPIRPCAGFSTLFKVKGLTSVHWGQPKYSRPGTLRVECFNALNALLAETDHPTKRELGAQQILIDNDAEAYI